MLFDQYIVIVENHLNICGYIFVATNQHKGILAFLALLFFFKNEKKNIVLKAP